MKLDSYKYLGILDNRYILENEIGDGISSKVYKAKDNTTGEIYAIKVFEKNASPIYEISINKKIKAFQSPFFTKYIRSSKGLLISGKTEEMKHYIVFELAKCELLNIILCKSSFPEGISEYLFYKIALIIQALHKNGICHRDIKTENMLLIGDNFEIKLCDFGVSSPIFDENGKILQNGRVGTEKYMAPEVNKNIKNYDGEKADIFSLGVILFLLKNYSMPFVSSEIHRKAKDNRVLYSYICDKKYDLYLKKRKLEGLEPEFQDLFFKMVAYDPNERPTIEQILNSDYLKKISKDNCEKYEQNLVKEFKERFDILNMENT